MSQVMFKSVSSKHVTFLFTHNAYINIHTLYFTKHYHHGLYFNFNSKNLILIPLQTWKINCTSSSLALMDKVIVPESLCKTI